MFTLDLLFRGVWLCVDWTLGVEDWVGYGSARLMGMMLYSWIFLFPFGLHG